MTTYYLMKRESLFIAAVSLAVAVVVFVFFVIYNDYKRHQTRTECRETKTEIRHLAPEPVYVQPKLPKRKGEK